MKRIISIFFVALLGGAGALTIDRLAVSHETAIQQGLPANYPVKFAGFNAMTPEGTVDFIKASEVSLPAVVHVKTKYAPKKNQFYFYDPFQGGWNAPQQQQPQMGSGSGVIISGDGYIVTNNHVIDDADKVDVTLHNRRTYTAKVIGKDASTDIALLKIEAQGLPYLLYGNSDHVKVGEWVLAVGNPFNLTSTVTAGIVSAKARNVGILSGGDPDRNNFPVESFIQTDAAVNPGNSGGALVNTSGQLIGINSAIASNTGSYTGYSFAVPVNLAKKVVNDLIEFGKVQRAFLGVSIRDLDSKIMEEKKMADTKGVYITGVSQGGGADAAGIHEGDVILKVGDVDVNNTSELQEQISHYRPGDKVALKLIREGEEKIFPVTLKSKSGDVMLAKADRNEVMSILGATFEPVSEGEMQKLGLSHGVKISSMDAGKLRSAGIKEGFIITSIDKRKVTSLDDVKLALENKEGGVLIEGVYTNGMKAYYAFGL